MGDPAGPGSDPVLEQMVFGSHPGDSAISRSHDKPRLPPWEGHLGGWGGAAEMKGPLGQAPDFLRHVLRTSSSEITQLLLCPALRCLETKVAQCNSRKYNQNTASRGVSCGRGGEKERHTHVSGHACPNVIAETGLKYPHRTWLREKGVRVGHFTPIGESRDVNTLRLICLPHTHTLGLISLLLFSSRHLN